MTPTERRAAQEVALYHERHARYGGAGMEHHEYHASAVNALLDTLDRAEGDRDKARLYAEEARAAYFAQSEMLEKAEAELEQAFREGLKAGEENVCTDGYFPVDKTPDEAVAAWRERRRKT